MGKKRSMLPEDSIAAVRAFGGYALICTRRYKISYATTLAKTIFTGLRLEHPELKALVEEAFTSSEQVTRPYAIADLGPIHDIVAQAAPLHDRWVLLTIADRTESVRANAIRRDFISNMGHELRTPTTAVNLLAQVITEVRDDPTQVAHFAQQLTQVAERLDRLTEDMIALARVQEVPEPKALDYVDINDIVEKAMGRLIEAAEVKKVKLRYVKRNAGIVHGDFQALVTAVENMISNAVHYSPVGSKVLVTTRIDEADLDATISVIDQGIGIALGEQERIFERFYRTDEARTHRTGGTGLGLAIVRNTALSHGGSVSVDSKPQHGSTFTLTLPLVAAPREVDQQAIGVDRD